MKCINSALTIWTTSALDGFHPFRHFFLYTSRFVIRIHSLLQFTLRAWEFCTARWS